MFRRITPLAEADCFVIFHVLNPNFIPDTSTQKFWLDFIENGKSAWHVVDDINENDRC